MASDRVSQAISFIVWAGVAASATAWTLTLWPRPSAATAVPVVRQTPDTKPPNPNQIAKWLGNRTPLAHADEAQASQPIASRLVLVGLVMAEPPPSMAMIAVDAAPAKTFVLGDAVLPGWALTAVNADHAVLQTIDGQATQLTLTFPAANPASDALASPLNLSQSPARP